MEQRNERIDGGAIELARLLKEFGPILRKLFWLPLLLAAVFAAAWLGKAYYTYTPMYECEVTFTIQIASDAEQSSGYGYYNKTVAEQLGKTFPYLISSELMNSRLKKELDVASVNGSISAQTIENTNLFTMRVVSPDPQDALAILQAVIKAYPYVADYVIGSTTMNLITEPQLPQKPYNSVSVSGEIIKGGLIGAAAGLALLLACAMLRKTVREAEDIKTKLNQVCLATLPRVSFKKRSRSGAEAITILNERVPAAFKESIRSLRLKLLRKLDPDACHAILVTSTMPGEGKTTVSSNLALALSQNGARVILIDMDLRRPSVKKALGIKEPSNGIVELRERKVASLDACITGIEGSSLMLLAGDVPRKSTRPISARWLKNLIDSLRSRADFIIVDTPPCGLLADSANIASAVDSALYVIGAGGVETAQILDGLQFLSESGVEVMGCILNGVKRSGGSYGYGYAYGYSRGYAQSAEAQKDAADNN